MSADRNTLSIEEFSTQFSQPQATPEVQAFSQLAQIETPAQVQQAIDVATTWGWW
ncbi:MAG: hypothetical protein IT317_01230 [Anaerolineales bacterium]|nr:hypothetical protein [Anaerolineales bacterium]